MSLNLPLILETEELKRHLGQAQLLIVDLCKQANYPSAHIPGAVYLDYNKIVSGQKPATGKLPPIESLNQTLSEIGLTADTHVVAYDDEGGGKACRFLWTLDEIGHRHFSFLNGGMHAWANERHPLEQGITQPTPSTFIGHYTTQANVELDDVLANLENKEICLVDTRSLQEYTGQKCYSQRGGHIPGALHLDWIQAVDQYNNLKLKPQSEILAMIEQLNISKDNAIIVYCQTHHRSSHSYIVFKSLGFKVKGYSGAWSEWGNHPDMPLEI